MSPVRFGRRHQIGQSSIDQSSIGLVGFGFAAVVGLQPVAAELVAVAGSSDPGRWFCPGLNGIVRRRIYGISPDGKGHRRLVRNRSIRRLPSEAPNWHQEPWQQLCGYVLQTLTCSPGWCAGT